MKKYKTVFHTIVLLLILLSCNFTRQAQSQSWEGVGSIVGLQAGQVTINWGSNDGIKTGASFVAFRQNQMVHPQTGEYLSVERDIIGRIEITRVDPSYSVGRFVSTQKSPQVGDFVELVIDAKNQYPFKETQPASGTITSRNENAISFTMGKGDGVEEGLYFDVVRGDKNVGKAVVTRVFDNSSLATLLSGQQDVRMGDRLELSDEQQSDMAMAMLTSQGQQMPSPPIRQNPMPAKTMVNQSNQSVVFATISSINGNKIKFTWLNQKAKAKTGILAGVYHQENLTHPLTGESLGSPLVRIGQLRVDEAKRKDGTGTLISQDHIVQVGDKVGYLTGARPAALSVPQAPVVQAKPRWRSNSLSKTASQLNQEVLTIQRELAYLRNMDNRITKIEKSITSQQRATRSLQSDVRGIKKSLEMITGGSVPEGQQLIPSQAPMELFGSHPGQSRMYSFKVSEDFKVKMQVQDKTLLVSLDRDSVRVQDVSSKMPQETMDEIQPAEGMSAQEKAIIHQPDDSESGAVDLSELLPDDEDQQAPFYIQHLYKIAGGAAGLLFLLAGFLFMKKKKGGSSKAKAGPVDDDDDDEGDEESEDEEDSLDDDDEEEIEDI